MVNEHNQNFTYIYPIINLFIHISANKDNAPYYNWHLQ